MRVCWVRVFLTLCVCTTITDAIIPLVHQIMLHGVFGEEITQLASGFVFMVIVYAFGAFVYTSRWPERISPGTFDIVGHSHQLWHCCVTAAAYLHYATLHNYLEYRQTFGCDTVLGGYGNLPHD